MSKRNYRVAGLSPSSLRMRRKLITGTDAPAILGLSRWRSAYDVFAEKTGLADDSETTDAMDWGNRLEPLVRWRFEEVTGRQLQKPTAILRNPAEPWMGGHVDGIDDEIVFEAKTARYADGWGESESDEFPVDYRVQLLHYLALTGRRRGELAVLIGGSDFRRYTIEPDEDLLRDLVDEERRWYLKHVVEGEPPPLDGSAAATRWLRRTHPSDSGEELVALPHQYAALAGVVAAERYFDEAKLSRELAHQLLMLTMGDASRLLAPGLRATWTTADRRTVDWRAMVEAYEATLHVYKATPLDREPYTTVKPVRTLRVTVGEESETAALGDPARVLLPESGETPHSTHPSSHENEEKTP
jgi:putative phage-type endonuclease